MNPLPRMRVAGAVLAIAAVGAWWWLTRVSTVASPRMLVDAGQTCEFDLAWDSHATSRMGGGAAGRAAADLGVDVSLRGTLTVDAATEGGRLVWSIRFEPTSASSMGVGGRSLLSGTAMQTAVSDARARIRLGEAGEVLDVAVSNDDSKVIELLARLLQTRLNPVWSTAQASTWSRRERNDLGEGDVRYHASGSGALERERGAYRELAIGRLIADANATVNRATTEWRWDGDAAVARVSDFESTRLLNGAQEQVGSLESSASLARLRCSSGGEPPDVRTARRWSRLDLAQPLVAGESSQESALERRIAGLTLDAMIAGLEHLALVPRDPEKTEFLVRATGLLMQHPEYSDALVPIATRTGLALEGRMVVLDVLASVGHDSAQAAMREALEHRELRAKAEDYNALVQRFSFVASPTEESLAWLEREWAQRGAAVGTAAALGSVAGRFAARGNDALATPAVTALTRTLEAATEPKLRADLILALGNVRSPLVVRTVLKEARAKAPEGRAAAAFALRGVDLPEARDMLVELARDPIPSVAMSAYTAIDAQPLDKAHLEALIEDIIAGRVPPSADATVVTFLSKHVEDSPYVIDALKAIAGRAESPDVKARAANLLRAKSTAL